MYQIDKELAGILRTTGRDCEIVPLLGSVCDEKRVRELIKTFGVQTVYHAAAYKHVPLVEYNLFEGIHNNVFGTMRTARAAMDCGVETFVLISTDKAVSPTSIMGASKRVAELIFAKDDRFNCAYNHDTRYRGRVVGHGAENDSRIVSTGVVLVSTEATKWHALLRVGALNRGGSPDARNQIENPLSSETDGDVRAFLGWLSQ